MKQLILVIILLSFTTVCYGNSNQFTIAGDWLYDIDAEDGYAAVTGAVRKNWENSFGIYFNPNSNCKGLVRILEDRQYTIQGNLEETGVTTLYKPIEFRIDQKAIWELSTIFVSTNDHTRTDVYFQPTEKFINELKYGNILRIKTDERYYTFSLKGSNTAISYTIKKCQNYSSNAKHFK